MKISKLVGERTKEVPSGVIAKSHEYLLRAGYIKQVCNGVFSLLPPAFRVQLKIEKIIREEMDKIGGQEVLLPVLMPKELWEESGRYSSIGSEMFRLKDRAEHDMVLGMTHEEAAVHLARNTIKSYDQLPFMIYQIQTKLRDEPRARAGLIRVREFIMKDAYSFHTSKEDLDEYYEKVKDAYFRIYKRMGMKNVVSVKSDSGMMGGKIADEFMLITDIGEDSLVVCDNCDYSANMEVAESILDIYDSIEQPTELVNTGDSKTIEDVCKLLNVKPYQTCKAVCYYLSKSKKYVIAFIRGDLEVNEIKLRNLLKEEVVAISVDHPKIVAGYIGPKNFKEEDIITLYDVSLKNAKNLVVGANAKPYHIKNFSFNRDFIPETFVDISKVKEGQKCKKCGKGNLKIVRGIEIGNIFQLGTKYTASMNMTVHDSKGEEINHIMGCYGIGVGRCLASIVEESSDEKGIIWPISVAPWQIYLCPLRLDDENVAKTTLEINNILEEAGYEILFDDRNISAGSKFADSELMGIPIRIVISPRSLQNNEIEITIRKTGEKIMCLKGELLKTLKSIVDNLG